MNTCNNAGMIQTHPPTIIPVTMHRLGSYLNIDNPTNVTSAGPTPMLGTKNNPPRKLIKANS